MKRAWLLRRIPTQHGTFGILAIPEHNWCCHTLEPCWRENKIFESCIPDGIYFCRWTKSPRLGRYTYEITGVEGRDGIRIHPGNWKEETNGCPMLGIGISYDRGRMHLTKSEKAVEEMEKLMAEETFELTIQWVPGLGI